jgi:hypothetical protein
VWHYGRYGLNGTLAALATSSSDSACDRQMQEVAAGIVVVAFTTILLWVHVGL